MPHSTVGRGFRSPGTPILLTQRLLKSNWKYNLDVARNTRRNFIFQGSFSTVVLFESPAELVTWAWYPWSSRKTFITSPSSPLAEKSKLWAQEANDLETIHLSWPFPSVWDATKSASLSLSLWRRMDVARKPCMFHLGCSSWAKPRAGLPMGTRGVKGIILDHPNQLPESST